MKKLSPILLICTVLMNSLLTSCMINRNYQAKAGLHYSGSYTVKSITGSEVKFKGIAGTYTVASDTLKAGDRITINVVRKTGGNEITKN